MRKFTFSFLAIALAAALSSRAQSTQPAPADPNNTLAFRANLAFNRGQYAAALPMLQQLATLVKDQPDQLGPVQEEISVCQKSIAAAPPTTTTAAGSVAVAMTAETRKVHPAPKAGEVLDMPIKDLGNFEYDPEHPGNIPDDVTRLSGSKIRLRGFMMPTDQAVNITEFALVPSLTSCCFGQPPQVQHTILCNTTKGKKIGDYVPFEIICEGTLKVEEKKDDGYVISVFQLEVSSVQPAPQ